MAAGQSDVDALVGLKRPFPGKKRTSLADMPLKAFKTHLIKRSSRTLPKPQAAKSKNRSENS
jgi:hypothetical protein